VKNNRNQLDLIPHRLREWEKGENSKIVLLVPKLRGKRLGKWLLSKLKRPYYKVRLDDFGSFIWEQCDGTKTVREIALSLKDKFGQNVEPVFDRACLFLDKLETGRFISYQNL